MGHSYHTGAPVSVFVHFSPKLFVIYCTNAFISSHFINPFCRHLWRPAFLLLAKCNPCHPWLEHYSSATLAGIVHIFRVPHRSLTSTLCSCSLCPASGTTSHRSWRPPDTRPCYTVAATIYLIHPPTKGSLESSHFLTSSMYLCHFLTSVASTKPFASGSRIPLLSTSAQFSRRATVS
jgi:hypothetical protein